MEMLNPFGRTSMHLLGNKYDASISAGTRKKSFLFSSACTYVIDTPWKAAGVLGDKNSFRFFKQEQTRVGPVFLFLQPNRFLLLKDGAQTNCLHCRLSVSKEGFINPAPGLSLVKISR